MTFDNPPPDFSKWTLDHPDSDKEVGFGFDDGTINNFYNNKNSTDYDAGALLVILKTKLRPLTDQQVLELRTFMNSTTTSSTSQVRNNFCKCVHDTAKHSMIRHESTVKLINFLESGSIPDDAVIRTRTFLADLYNHFAYSPGNNFLDSTEGKELMYVFAAQIRAEFTNKESMSRYSLLQYLARVFTGTLPMTDTDGEEDTRFKMTVYPNNHIQYESVLVLCGSMINQFFKNEFLSWSGTGKSKVVIISQSSTGIDGRLVLRKHADRAVSPDGANDDMNNNPPSTSTPSENTRNRNKRSSATNIGGSQSPKKTRKRDGSGSLSGSEYNTDDDEDMDDNEEQDETMGDMDEIVTNNEIVTEGGRNSTGTDWNEDHYKDDKKWDKKGYSEELCEFRRKGEWTTPAACMDSSQRGCLYQNMVTLTKTFARFSQRPGKNWASQEWVLIQLTDINGVGVKGPTHRRNKTAVNAYGRKEGIAKYNEWLEDTKEGGDQFVTRSTSSLSDFRMLWTTKEEDEEGLHSNDEESEDILKDDDDDDEQGDNVYEPPFDDNAPDDIRKDNDDDEQVDNVDKSPLADNPPVETTSTVTTEQSSSSSIKFPPHCGIEGATTTTVVSAPPSSSSKNSPVGSGSLFHSTIGPLDVIAEEGEEESEKEDNVKNHEDTPNFADPPDDAIVTGISKEVENNVGKEKDDVNKKDISTLPFTSQGRGITVIDFNPVEIRLLELAFDDDLSPRDLRNKALLYGMEDFYNCQKIIHRMKGEFMYTYKKRVTECVNGVDVEVDVEISDVYVGEPDLSEEEMRLLELAHDGTTPPSVPDVVDDTPLQSELAHDESTLPAVPVVVVDTRLTSDTGVESDNELGDIVATANKLTNASSTDMKNSTKKKVSKKKKKKKKKKVQFIAPSTSSATNAVDGPQTFIAPSTASATIVGAGAEAMMPPPTTTETTKTVGGSSGGDAILPSFSNFIAPATSSATNAVDGPQTFIAPSTASATIVGAGAEAMMPPPTTTETTKTVGGSSGGDAILPSFLNFIAPATSSATNAVDGRNKATTETAGGSSNGTIDTPTQVSIKGIAEWNLAQEREAANAAKSESGEKILDQTSAEISKNVLAETAQGSNAIASKLDGDDSSSSSSSGSNSSSSSSSGSKSSSGSSSSDSESESESGSIKETTESSTSTNKK
jgi:hypothetical protein